MTTVDLETYEGQLSRLDVPYIFECGTELRARLFPRPKEIKHQDGSTVEVPVYPLPAALAYEPGNGTRYDLLFVTASSIRQLTDSTVPAGIDENEWVVVSKLNGETFSFPIAVPLGSYIAESYIAEKSGLGLADSVAITALLRVLAGGTL